ncbi:MAG: zinc-binding dehydrogenase, partial [Clostridia bacterium]|nr:zinc-binding dehydrogenase [Deltaproteobacteria bacterium]
GGGQAEYVRVPFADFGCFSVPSHLTDEQVLFLTDVFPTGYMAAENCNIRPGDVVAVWGCGPVGQFAMRSAYMLGASRVIGIDRIAKRLELARNQARAETLNYEECDVLDCLQSLTGGRGPDACIDAVGLEAHGIGAVFAYDKVKQAMRMTLDRPYALRQALIACKAGGTVSVPGVYGGFLDKMPFGAFVNKGLTLKTGQTHVHRYLEPLMARIEGGEIDPSYIITHRGNLDDAPEFYATFMHKEDDCVKCIMKPGSGSATHAHNHAN